MIKVGDALAVSGCFTKEKFIAGRTLVEIEKILGFHHGRLAGGIAIAARAQLPDLHQFELAAYSNVATHRFKMPTNLNVAKIKTEARNSWATTGFERLVKVLPTIRHDANMDSDLQYPPGYGAPQWISKVPLAAQIVAVVDSYPNGSYSLRRPTAA